MPTKEIELSKIVLPRSEVASTLSPGSSGFVRGGGVQPEARDVRFVALDHLDRPAGRMRDHRTHRHEGAEPGVTTRAFHGFNLDGRNSPSRRSSQQPADCSHGDYFSVVDPDQKYRIS